MDYPGLEDYLLVAESVLELPAETVLYVTDIPLAESALAAPRAAFGGVEAYSDPIDKAAVLCGRVANNHALPDGNKRTAWVLTREFLARNGYEFRPPTGGQQEIGAAVERLAGEPPAMTEAEFADWLRPLVPVKV